MPLFGPALIPVDDGVSCQQLYIEGIILRIAALSFEYSLPDIEHHSAVRSDKGQGPVLFDDLGLQTKIVPVNVEDEQVGIIDVSKAGILADQGPQVRDLRGKLCQGITFNQAGMHGTDVIQGIGPCIIVSFQAPQPVQFLLQQAGIAARPLLLPFHERTASPAQIEPGAVPAFLVETTGGVDPADLLRSRLHDPAHAVPVDISIIEIRVFLAPNAGINISVLLQQVELFPAVDTVGAVVRPKLPEPGSLQSRLEFRSRKGVPDPAEKLQLLLFRQGVQKPAAVFKADHKVEVQHIQTGVLMQIPDILDYLADPFQMFPENSRGHLPVIGKVLQKRYIGEDLFQGIPAVFAHPEPAVKGQRQVYAAAHRYIICADGIHMAVEIEQICLDMGLADPEAGACQKASVLFIVLRDIFRQFPEFILFQAGDLAAVQGDIEGNDILRMAFVHSIGQGLQRTAVSMQILCLVLQIAVPAGHIAGHGRHIKQVYISIGIHGTGSPGSIIVDHCRTLFKSP